MALDPYSIRGQTDGQRARGMPAWLLMQHAGIRQLIVDCCCHFCGRSVCQSGSPGDLVYMPLTLLLRNQPVQPVPIHGSVQAVCLLLTMYNMIVSWEYVSV